MIDCTSFEGELAALAAGQVPDAERGAALARLETHARTCADCAGARDLMRLLAAPPGQRDLVDVPGEDYWAGFERRLQSRLRNAEPPAHNRPRTLVLAAAAVGASALIGAWLVLRNGNAPPATPPAGERASAPAAVPEAPAPEPEADPLPPELTAGLVDPLDGPAGEHLDDLVGWGTGWADEGLFPEIDGLDADSRRKLLGWLEEQS